MRAVVQRVSQARVEVDNKKIGKIGKGLMVLIGIEENDEEKDVIYMADKLIGLRIFEDENDKMNLSVLDAGGEILLISQFTLYGDARKGKRPSFISAARPEKAIPLYERLIKLLGESIHVETGEFGAHMEVSLINDGPVTILLESRRLF